MKVAMFLGDSESKRGKGLKNTVYLQVQNSCLLTKRQSLYPVNPTYLPLLPSIMVQQSFNLYWLSEIFKAGKLFQLSHLGFSIWVQVLCQAFRTGKFPRRICSSWLPYLRAQGKGIVNPLRWLGFVAHIEGLLKSLCLSDHGLKFKKRKKKREKKTRRQRVRELVSPTVYSSRHWPGPLGQALVASGTQGSEDCLLAGFSFSPTLFFSFCSLGYDDLKMSLTVSSKAAVSENNSQSNSNFPHPLNRQAGGN